MDKLTHKDIEDLAARLRAQREELLAALRARLHASDDPALLALSERIGSGDQPAAAELLNEDAVALLGHELERLGAVEAALAAVAAGSYGRCVHCGEPIERKRMLVQPTARFCLLCQQRFERHPALPHV